MVVHQDKIVIEKYWGKHSHRSDARFIQDDSQFHVASVRKSYIGFAVAYALYHGQISSIDDPVTNYISTLDREIMNGTTIRHLLTHTHGLKRENERIEREFSPGERWAYCGVGVDFLCDIVHQTTGKTISQILAHEVFKTLDFKETEWLARLNSRTVEVIREPYAQYWETYESTDGDKMNLYVSPRELAYWGYLHLSRGNLFGKQVIPREIVDWVTKYQSPKLTDTNSPQNGFLWFVKNHSASQNEIGELVPKGSYQILGYTGVTLLVIPHHQTVVVRMFNSWGSPPGYDYLSDVRGFGNQVMRCLIKENGS